MTEQLQQAVADAQLVLVGIGKEMESPLDRIEQDPFYLGLLAQAEAGGDQVEKENAAAMKQYICCHFLKNHPDEKRKAAYMKLAELLKGKNYFVVSLCMDDLICGSGLDAGRVVTPCGGYQALQCMESNEEGKPLCQTDQELLVTDSAVIDQVMRELDACGGNLDRVDFPVCNECGRILGFNQVMTPGYREEGYLPQWQKYMKWLQGTMNRQVCILELGAGMEYPSVMRFPFEKLAFFNQKASFFRVHSRLWQLTEELKEKGVAIAQNPVDFLLE